MHQRLALLGTTLALSVPLGIAAAPAQAAPYPSSVKSGFLKSCKKAAKGEGVTSKQASSYCNASLKCLQRELSLNKFKQYGTDIAKGDKTPRHNRVVKRCIKEAARSLKGRGSAGDPRRPERRPAARPRVPVSPPPPAPGRRPAPSPGSR